MKSSTRTIWLPNEQGQLKPHYSIFEVADRMGIEYGSFHAMYYKDKFDKTFVKGWFLDAEQVDTFIVNRGKK